MKIDLFTSCLPPPSSSSSNTPGHSTSHSTYFHTSASTLLDSLRKPGQSGDRSIDSITAGNRGQNSSTLTVPPPQPRFGSADLALPPRGNKDDNRLEVFGGPRGLSRFVLPYFFSSSSFPSFLSHTNKLARCTRGGAVQGSTSLTPTTPATPKINALEIIIIIIIII